MLVPGGYAFSTRLSKALLLLPLLSLYPPKRRIFQCAAKETPCLRRAGETAGNFQCATTGTPAANSQCAIKETPAINSQCATKETPCLRREGETTCGALAERLAGLYQRKQYLNVIRIARTLSNVTPDIVRVALSSIRKQQRNDTEPPPRINKSRQLAKHAAAPRQIKDELLLELAHRLVDLLAQQDRQLVTAAHLSKLLEISVSSSLHASSRLPRQVHPWLSAYTRYGVEPSVHAFAILMHAYLRSGDTEYALWIYGGMERGELAVPGADGRASAMRVPPPNAVATATVAQAWCQLRQWPRVHAALDRVVEVAPGDAQRLVTRAVSTLVDDGHVDAAEALWLKYGAPATTAGCALNDRALAKLVLGCTRAGRTEKATAYFRAACDHASQAAATAPRTYLTGLLNAVLRCALDDRGSTLDDQEPVRPELEVLRIATRHGIKFDGDTYGVLISRLSRVAGHHELTECVARAMHGLYTRMCDDHIPIDDMALSHLAPIWVYLDQSPLVTVFWRMHTRDRPTRKIAQIRRHIMHQAAHWGLVERVSHLLT